MEATAGIVEDTLFPGVAQKRFYAPNLAYAGNYVVKVTPNNSYGPKRFLPVSQGDTVNAYVQAYTERPAPIQTSVSKPGKLLTWFAGMVGVNRGDANIKPIPTAGIALALGVSQSPAVFSSNATGPAEMKWKFYDSDSVLVDEGAVEMSGNTGDWEELSKQLIAEQAGYIELSLKGGGSTSYSAAEVIEVGCAATTFQRKLYISCLLCYQLLAQLFPIARVATHFHRTFIY